MEWVECEGKGGVKGLSSGAEVRDKVRGEYRFVESLTLLSQRLNARGGEGVGKGGVWVYEAYEVK